MRYDHYTKLYIDQDIEIYDTLSSDMRGFSLESGYQEYQLTEQDVLKPYTISQNFYDTVDYTDIIFMLNGVENILEDLFPGMNIILPTLSSIQNFQFETKSF